MSLSLFRSDRFVGIDIGHSSLAVAQVEQSGGTFRVLHLGRAPVPEDTVADGVVVDPDALGYAIRDLLRASGISATMANIAVAGPAVVVRTVKMPTMSEDALRKSIRFEAGRYVPSSVEESYIDFEIVSHDEEGQMSVLIVAAPRDMVESKVRAIQAAGLDVENVEVEAFAQFRALVEADDLSDFESHVVALVDVGGQSTEVTVVQHGTFALTRSIPIGGDAMTEALASYFKMSPEEAEAGKRSLDLTGLIQQGPQENPPLRVVQPIVDELVREIRRSLNYYQSQQTEAGQPSQVTHLMFSGGGAHLTGFPEYVSHKLNMTGVVPNLFENPRFVFAGAEPPADGSAYSVAIGLAMRRAGKAVLAA
ncbi:MAG: fimbrial assembly protein [Fimbriimonadales bacterium]|nr:MAG: fimbrial assembly protein [Fimbriimonadales bacterium]